MEGNGGPGIGRYTLYIILFVLMLLKDYIELNQSGVHCLMDDCLCERQKIYSASYWHVQFLAPPNSMVKI